MLNFLDNIIDETKNDNQLFARYGFKFVDCIENHPKESRKILENRPNFKNDFQLIFLSGIIEHFFPDNKPKWVSNEKLDRPWGYMTGYNVSDKEKNIKNYYSEMVSRGIFAL